MENSVGEVDYMEVLKEWDQSCGTAKIDVQVLGNDDILPQSIEYQRLRSKLLFRLIKEQDCEPYSTIELQSENQRVEMENIGLKSLLSSSLVSHEQKTELSLIKEVVRDQQQQEETMSQCIARVISENEQYRRNSKQIE